MSIILIILISNLIKEDTLISTSEKKRKLATFPKLSLSKIFDNSFSDEFENIQWINL